MKKIRELQIGDTIYEVNPLEQLSVDLNSDEIIINGDNNNGDSIMSVTIPQATAQKAGVMSAADKEKLDSLTQDYGNTEPEFIEFADLIAKAERGELEVGKEYRYPYTLVVLDDDNEYFRYKSAGHYFDIVTKALTQSTLCEKVRIMYNENDSYFKDWNANVGAWQVWINMQRPTQVDICYMPNGEEFINTKGQIYKMIDENGIECNYDFKNMLFKCCVESNYFDDSSENDFKITIPYEEARVHQAETEPIWLYTFSSYLTEDKWAKNIFDISLYDRKYNSDGFKILENIKINLLFADEGSVCVIKIPATVDTDGAIYPNTCVYQLNINSTVSCEICCFNTITNVNIINSSKVYLQDCDSCDIINTSCVLSSTYNSKVTGGKLVGLSECDNCEINNSNYVYLFDNVYSKYTEVRSDPSELDYQDYFIPYIMSPDEWCNMREAYNCDFKGLLLQSVGNSNNIKIHYVINDNTNVYLHIHDCSNVEINRLNLNYTGKEDKFALDIDECVNMIFGNNNTLQLGQHSYIHDCNNVNVGNDNNIELRIDTETEKILGMNNISSITIGHNNTSIFISNCSNINIGNSNDEVFIVGRNIGIYNLTVKNYNSIYLSDLTSLNNKVHINNMVIGNNCYVQLCDLDRYLVENRFNNTVEFSNIHIKNGSTFQMFTDPQEQYAMRTIFDIEVDRSSIDNLGINAETVKNIKFINSEINRIYFSGSTSETIKNIVFKDCVISQLIVIENVTTNGLYTVTMDEDGEIYLNDWLLSNYPIQYIVDGKAYGMAEIL